jgi:ppGpp synthetase/RelA/SpoT-type nucleotidyltranferase
MIFRESITMRPLKWAVIATHSMRDKLDSIDVDFTRAEQAIADKIEALSTKMDQIMERLEAYESEEADSKPKSKAKTTRRGATGKGRTAAKG